MSSEKNYRQLLVLSGEQDKCQTYAKQLTAKLDCINYDGTTPASRYLGGEYDAVLFHTHKTFDPNALGILTGTIRAGGYLIVIKPTSWADDSQFLRRFESLLKQSDWVQFFDLNSKVLMLPKPPLRQCLGDYASDDQQQAVEAIIKVVKGHRRRPLVITADRGRGKSAALGIASAQLFDSGISNIIITAPSKTMAAVVFEQAKRKYPQDTLCFFSPDELQQQKPKADLLLVDEAGAIPLSILEDFVQHYSRIVFATTLHGYEGCGRGFTLKFFKTLDLLAPEWKHCTLQTPIRYSENDPLENFMFKALLLNAEPVKTEFIEQTKLEDCYVEALDKQELIDSEQLLSNIFGLLVTAHYQTKPSDLKLLLDDKDLTVYALLSGQKQIVAVAITIKEGGIKADLATEIFQGNRRLKGHLAAQALAANVGVESAPCLVGERVSRIAVHPQRQNKGFGSHLLKIVCERVNADYVSTSYGATTALINFWQKQGFIAVYLGMKRDASSGVHSLLMLKGISKDGKKLTKDAQLRFTKNYIQLLSEPFKNLKTEMVLSLLSTLKTDQFFEVTEDEKQELNAFAVHQRGYENTLYAIWTLTAKALSQQLDKLDAIEQAVLIHKVLQKNTWADTKNSLGLSGKSKVLDVLRQAVAKLILQGN